MPSTIVWFATDAFVDSEDEREERINDNLGGAALSKWLSGALRASGHAGSEPWAEDHGWDFTIKGSAGTYMIVCTIDDMLEPHREACVQVHLGKYSRAQLDPLDPVLKDVLRLVEAEGATPRIE
jgi:hypothetical protein